MSDGTAIEWTDATLNVVNGCSVLSPGCTNCYAMRSGGRNLPNHPATGLTKATKAGHVWTGEVRFNDKALLQPLRWKRPRKIFWNAHGDLFHEKVPDEWIDRCFAVMALTSHHIHQVLTKRPDRMRDYLSDPATAHPRWMRQALKMRSPAQIKTIDHALPNVWLGVSVEDQQRADERIPVLLETPAAVRWLSCEPLLGPVDLSAFAAPVHHHPSNRDRNSEAMQRLIKAARDRLGGGIDWVVAGGESGPGARPMHPDWARLLRDQCAAAGVPFLFKQWGNWGPDDGPPAIGKDTIFEGLAKAAVMVDGAWKYLDNGFQGPIEWCKRADDWLFHVGKKAAGRALDGVQHDGYPA